MSTAYQKLATVDRKHRDALDAMGREFESANANTKAPTDRYTRRSRQQDTAAHGLAANNHLFKIQVIGKLASELPAGPSIEAAATAIHDHDTLDKALASMPAALRSGPAGEHVRRYFQEPGPFGHDLDPKVAAALEEYLDEALHGPKMGSDAAGAGGISTGRQSDGGLHSKKGSTPERDLHNEAPTAGTKAPKTFADASKEMRARLQDGDK